MEKRKNLYVRPMAWTKVGECWWEGWYRAEGNKGKEKIWDNCNNIINKIYLKKRLISLLWSSLSSWRLCARCCPHAAQTPVQAQSTCSSRWWGLWGGSPGHWSPVRTETWCFAGDPPSYTTFWKLPLSRKLGAFLSCTECCPVPANRSFIYFAPFSDCSLQGQVLPHWLLHRWKKRLSRGA